MGLNISEVTKIKRRVLTGLAKLAWEGNLGSELASLPKKIIADSKVRYRCCEYKEQAILVDRIKLAMEINPDQNEEESLTEAADRAWRETERVPPPVTVTIIEKACDRCPIDKMIVTNACRNCVAHHCLNSCPKKAIEIIQDRAYINKTRCVECGVCAKACPFGAILEVERPCSRVCAVGAIGPGESSSAKIDYHKCVECGACINACPFGAISERSDLLKVIKMLKQADIPVQALVAPSVAGQFGPAASWGRVTVALKRLGFATVIPVALGAKRVAKAEGEELSKTIQTGAGPLFNSCCPSFNLIIEKHFPDLKAHISTIKSPMVVTAESETPVGKRVFIGPCLAKKGEAYREGKDLIDAVLTFEELAAVLVAAGINLAEFTGEDGNTDYEPSGLAIGFASSGGVRQAVLEEIRRTVARNGKEPRTISVSGVKDCRDLLKRVKMGKDEFDFVEGMGCENGCIGGPGTLVDFKTAFRALTTSQKSKGADQVAS